MKLHHTVRLCLLFGLGTTAVACDVEDDARPQLEDYDDDDAEQDRLSGSALVARANAIKAAHAGHALIDNPILFAGIAGAETGLSHCFSEYDWGGCPGQFTSPDCGGGVILAGGADGTCEQGGLGMFQFDEGTQTQTRNHWANVGKWPIGAPVKRDVVSLQGNIQASIDFILYKAWISDRTPYFPSQQAMYDWINGIRPIDGDPDFELWLGFLAYNYNGWGWGGSGWANAKNKYRNNTLALYGDLGGWDFWYGDDDGGGGGATPCSIEGGLWCGGNGVTGDADTLYVCSGGVLVVQEACDNGCYWAPPGVQDACNAPAEGPSCSGMCGKNAGGCWCDSVCTQYGDCCADKVAACG